MKSFLDWLKIQESSPSTRLKRQIALGLAPPTADIFGHSTPNPWEIDRLKKALRKKKKKKKKLDEARIKPVIHKEIDSFIQSVQSLAKDVWELNLLKKKLEAKEKMEKIAKKASPEQPKEKKEKDAKINQPNQKPKKPAPKE